MDRSVHRERGDRNARLARSKDAPGPAREETGTITDPVPCIDYPSTPRERAERRSRAEHHVERQAYRPSSGAAEDVKMFSVTSRLNSCNV